MEIYDFSGKYTGSLLEKDKSAHYINREAMRGM